MTHFRNQKILILIFLFVFAGIFIFSAQSTQAACPAGGSGIWKNTKCSTSVAVGTSCKTYPIKPCNFCDAMIVGSNILNYFIEIVIPLAVGMTVYGAIMMMVAAGSEERFKSARKIITSAIVGVVIAFSAWVIVNTVIRIIANPQAFPIPWSRIQC